MRSAARPHPDTQNVRGGAALSLPTANGDATPTVFAPSADLEPSADPLPDDAQVALVGGTLARSAAQIRPDAHSSHGGAHLDPDAPGHVERGNQMKIAGSNGASPSADHGSIDTQNCGVGGTPHDALLLILADALDDLERARIATQNRLRSLGQVKGLADSREARTMQNIADTLGELEHKAALDLQRAMRAHPLGPWLKRTVGIGEKQGARLLAAIGDPATRKMPSQLWQYCGHGEPSKLRRGIKTFWNPTAKMRLHLIAESCMKAGVRKLADCDDTDGYDFARREAVTPLGAVYLKARANWADRDVPDGHKHNHALRMVGKAILLDLWLEAKAA